MRNVHSIHSVHNVIAASIAGRVRLRHEALRRPQLLHELATKISACAPVTQVQPKMQAASLVVHYDPAQWSVAQSHQHLTAVLLEMVPHVPTPQQAQPEQQEQHIPEAAMAAVEPTADAHHPHHLHHSRHHTRSKHKHRVRRMNRWAKRAMLGTLAVSMLLALQGAKRGHALTGVLFLHALGLHLWVHRRNLLK